MLLPSDFPGGTGNGNGDSCEVRSHCKYKRASWRRCLDWAYDENSVNHQGEFIGYFACEDIGGTKAINNGWVIDMWVESLQHVKYMTLRTGGKVVVQYVEEK